MNSASDTAPRAGDLADRRRRAGLRKQQLAGRAEVSVSTVAALEQGRGRPASLARASGDSFGPRQSRPRRLTDGPTVARPETSQAAEELYAALAPVQEATDEAPANGAGLKVCMALVAGKIDLLHRILIDDVDDLAALEVVFDPLRCPVEFLPYLAQFDGAIFRPDMDDDARRKAVLAPEAFSRGRRASIEAVATRRLTGTKTVVVTERYTGDAWKLRVETLAETPEPEERRREIVEFQKPIGIVLFFNTRTPWTWGEVKAERSTYPDWEAVKADFPTQRDFRTHEP